jgi:hypothetical protein
VRTACRSRTRTATSSRNDPLTRVGRQARRHPPLLLPLDAGTASATSVPSTPSSTRRRRPRTSASPVGRPAARRRHRRIAAEPHASCRTPRRTAPRAPGWRSSTRRPRGSAAGIRMGRRRGHHPRGGEGQADSARTSSTTASSSPARSRSAAATSSTCRRGTVRQPALPGRRRRPSGPRLAGPAPARLRERPAAAHAGAARGPGGELGHRDGLVYKQGEEGKGRPSDIFMRRSSRRTAGNPYAFKNFVCNETVTADERPDGLRRRRPEHELRHADGVLDNPNQDDHAKGEGIKVVKYEQTRRTWPTRAGPTPTRTPAPTAASCAATTSSSPTTTRPTGRRRATPTTSTTSSSAAPSTAV